MVEQGAYRLLFGRYLATGLAHMLRAVTAAGDILADETRVQAWHLLSFALRQRELWPGSRDLLLALAPRMERRGLQEEWLAHLQAGAACGEAAGDLRAAAALRLALGEVLRHLGRLDDAQQELRRSLQAAVAVEDSEQTAAARVALGGLAVLREEWEEAFALCSVVLREPCISARTRARALFVIADACAATHEEERAYDHYSRSLALWEQQGSKTWMALCRHNLAWLSVKADHETARSHFGAALAAFQELQAPHAQAVVLIDWGIVEYQSGNLAAALAHYQAAESILRRLDDTRYLAMVCNNIALAYRSGGQWQEAEVYYAESIELWRVLGAVLARLSVELGLGKLWLDRGEPQEALAIFQQVSAALRSTPRSAEHRRLYAELKEYSAAALAAQAAVPPEGLAH
jgi:tetratricopeptide (TPR) repeat protein